MTRAPAYGAEQARILLHRLAPWARHLRAGPDLAWQLHDPDHSPDHRLHGPLERPGTLARGIEGLPPGVDEPVADCAVVSTLFHARRPFHPRRLHDALEDIADGPLRSRGHLWLASQPELVLAWKCAGGGVGMGSLGRWLTALPANQWSRASDERRLVATIDWDLYYGDRHSHLAVIGLSIDADEIRDRLTSCLLTDAELATGEDAWRRLSDPFAGLFDDDTDSDLVEDSTDAPDGAAITPASVPDAAGTGAPRPAQNRTSA